MHQQGGIRVNLSANMQHRLHRIRDQQLFSRIAFCGYMQCHPCDASAPPANGGVGTCTSNLISGSACQPTCNTGYTGSGTSRCSAGSLIGSDTIGLDSCSVVATAAFFGSGANYTSCRKQGCTHYPLAVSYNTIIGLFVRGRQGSTASFTPPR